MVTKFAVFYGGVARTTRGQVTAGFTLAACQALAGASGSALADPRFTAVSRSPLAGTNTIQAAIDACNSGGGGTVTLSGSYIQTANLVLKSRVRITTSDSATITLTGAATQVITTPPAAMPTLSNANALNAGAQSYTVNNGLTDDSIFLAVHNTALGTLYQVTGVQNTSAKKTDLIPIRTRTASSITFARAPFFTYAASAALAMRGYTPTVDLAIDGNITITKNGGTSNTSVVFLRAVRRARFNNITIQQATTNPGTDIDLLGVVITGSTEFMFNGCTVTTNSSDGDPTSIATHPYAFKASASSHYDLFNHTGHSRGWHAIDNESDNPHANWGVGAFSALWGGQWGDMRNCTLSSIDNNFPGICHTSDHIRFLDHLFTSGGGISVDGYAHSFECIEASPGGRNTQIAHTRGVGATRIWHCDFNNNLGNWGNGSFGMTKCNYGDLHYLTPPDTSTFGRVPHDGSNTFTDVDTATNGFPLS